ncbi:MAG: ABC transporter substrate-binding protein [Spirochaetales bacterium]
MKRRFSIGALALIVAFAVLPVTGLFAATPADQLIIGMSMNNLLSLDPASATGLDVAMVNANLYDMLLELDPTSPSTMLPAVAESWKVAPDGQTITFVIRKGIKFQSGNPLTADDVAWSLRRVLKLNMSLASAWKVYGFSKDTADESFKAVDPYTFVVKMPKPTDPKLILFNLGSSPSAFILDSKKVLENQKNNDMGNAWLTTNAAGSGPFKLDDWRAKDALIMSRFDGYWRAPSKLRRVILRHMTESQSMRLMIEKGDIDVAYGMTVADINALKDNKDISVEAIKKGTLYYVAVSMRDPKYSNIKVRQAIRLLIDYEGINKTIMPNYGFFHQRPIQAGLPATLPDQGYKLDVAAAKKLLAEAGYPNGFKTVINVLSDLPYINIATSLQATLAQGGIQAEVISGTGNQVYGYMRERKFEIIVGRGGGGSIPHPDSNLRSMVYNPDNSDAAKLDNLQGWRTSFYNEEINTLIDKALLEKDEKAQLAMYRRVQELYEQEAAPIFTVSQMIDTSVLRGDIENFATSPSSTTRFREVFKKR